MRIAAALAVALTILILAGCLDERPAAPTDSSEPPTVEEGPANATFFLKPGHELDPSPPAASGPVREPAGPTSPGFVSENLELFHATSTIGINVTQARLVLYYEVDRPTPDPFRSGAAPPEMRHFVIWLGAQGVFPTFVSVDGDPVLIPGPTYSADIEFPLPAGGWVVPPNDVIQLLVVPLAVNDGPPSLHYLVDHESTASRLELAGTPWNQTVPAAEGSESQPFTIPANSGAFTGATAGETSQVRAVVEWPANATYVELLVDFVSNAGGKSDLDFTLVDASGTVVASSTTPYQDEAIRLFSPNLAVLGPGPFTAVIDAYSGEETRFDLVTTWNSRPQEPISG